jgi:hypothetical protein
VLPPGSFRPRDEADRVLRAASVVHRRDHEVNKRLHLETAWGVLARFEDGTCLARRRVRLTGESFGSLADLDHLTVPEELVQRLSAAVESRDARVYWKADDPVAALRRIDEDQRTLRDRLHALCGEEPETETVASSDGSAGRSRKRPEAERLARALERYREETGRRSALVFARRTLLLIGEPTEPGRRPRRAYETKGNAWLDIRRGEDGKPYWQALTRIDALRLGPDEEPPLLRIFAGDTLEVTDAAGARRLCRVLSVSTGDVQLLPATDARPPKESPHRGAFRYTSLRRFLGGDPVQVVCDPAGRVRWRGPRRRNW